jgi:hypothetical protein
MMVGYGVLHSCYGYRPKESVALVLLYMSFC